MASSTAVDDWVMACAPAVTGRAPYQFAISASTGYYGMYPGTWPRDVSPMLDLLALTETPFVNKIGWGSESGVADSIEWLTEDLGPGYVQLASNLASAGISAILNSIDGVTCSDLMRQLHEGTILYAFNSEDAYHGIFVVTSDPVVATTMGTIHVSQLELDTYATTFTTTGSQTNFYILGNVQNEGSVQGRPAPRRRVSCSNIWTILRQDVAITGSMKNSDMYAIGREDKHQILMRMKEMQRDREKLSRYSIYSAKTSVAAGLMNGVFGFLTTQTGTHIDRSTTALTETAVNTIVSKIWENGGRNLSFWGSISQTVKFTRWDKNRIRTTVNEGKGGGYITSYLTEAGIVLDLYPLANAPKNLAFILDTGRIQLIPKRGRKAILEPLGKAGDFDAWQLISEFTMKMEGYNLGQHGMFNKLT